MAPLDDRKVRSIVGRQKSAVDLVLHEIRRSILTGDLPPGQPFTVPALTERLGVSHVPVREALRQLEAQGLVVLNRSRSAIVTPLDPDDLRSIYRLRLRLEPELAAHSAIQRSQSEITEFEDLIHAAFDTTLGEDSHWEMHRRFHAALISPAAQAWDLRLLAPLWDAAERYTRLVFDPVEAPAETTATREHAHDKLVAAARSKDPEQVRAELRRHLETNLESTLNAMLSITASETPSWLRQDVTA